MITEDYVSFETAKLLKKKGFNENTSCKYVDKEGATEEWYDDYRERILRFNWDRGLSYRAINRTKDKYNVYGDTISAPTLQMAMKWLREVHDIYIMIDKDFATENGWHYLVTRKQDWADNIDNGLTQQESNSYTYEFACESAIKYCLENLI